MPSVELGSALLVLAAAWLQQAVAWRRQAAAWLGLEAVLLLLVSVQVQVQGRVLQGGRQRVHQQNKTLLLQTVALLK
jgi:hypothetical protein